MNHIQKRPLPFFFEIPASFKNLSSWKKSRQLQRVLVSVWFFFFLYSFPVFFSVFCWRCPDAVAFAGDTACRAHDLMLTIALREWVAGAGCREPGAPEAVRLRASERQNITASGHHGISLVFVELSSCRFLCRLTHCIHIYEDEHTDWQSFN